MPNYTSLEEFKERHKILDRDNAEISSVFLELYSSFLYNDPDEEVFTYELIDELFKKCMNISVNLIPYSGITNIVFSHSNLYSSENTFTEKFKSEFEKYITKKFSIDENRNSEERISTRDFFTIRLEPKKLKITEEDSQGVLVIYKIIQHTELAIAQKESLYETQREDVGTIRYDIDTLNEKITGATKNYDNMISNFISILGIFAAIMMSSFGAIQGFTSIYMNENNYSLTEIFTISSFGLFALLTIVYLLIISISKLMDKNIEEREPYHYGRQSFFKKHPIYSFSMIITFLLFILSLTHKFKYNSPAYFSNHLIKYLWGYTSLFLLALLMLYIIHSLISDWNGYWEVRLYLNNKIRRVKNKIGVPKVVLLTILGVILLTVISVIFIFIISL